jgi:hypothetical protein
MTVATVTASKKPGTVFLCEECLSSFVNFVPSLDTVVTAVIFALIPSSPHVLGPEHSGTLFFALSFTFLAV